MALKTIGIIPARGGSKRIPGKNIRDFLGKPIIAYSIEAALNSGLFDEVMVSTDDEEIASIARRYGASVPFMRSADNAGDFATTFDVIREVVDSYAAAGKTFGLACCIYPCAPFVSPEKLQKARDLLITDGFDAVYPIVSFSFPLQRALKMEGNAIGYCYPEYALTRSQDLEERYHDAGQFYWMQLDRIFAKGSIVTDNTGALVISALEAQDIDNEIDWKIAELKYKLIDK